MKIEKPEVLAFERKLSPSDARMYSGTWKNKDDASAWSPICLKEKAVRGTISNHLKAAMLTDPAKLNAEVRKPNLQVVDIASLPAEHDTLRVSFSLRVLGNVSLPSTCNKPSFQESVGKKLHEFASGQGYADLAYRYAYNLAAGRFLWRNRIGAESVSVTIRHLRDSSEGPRVWCFDACTFDLGTFSTSCSKLKEVADVIERGLRSNKYTLLEIDAFVCLGNGQEVFPSQELVMKSEKSKHLYEVDGTASLHSQKVGNAIRTIDTWHPAGEEVGPIAVEPYGAVTSRGVAYRHPSSTKQDFYTLMDRWFRKEEALTNNEQLFVVANLIRGGVFGKAGD